MLGNTLQRYEPDDLAFHIYRLNTFQCTRIDNSEIAVGKHEIAELSHMQSILRKYNYTVCLRTSNIVVFDIVSQ
jgi:hypothetical protein